MISFNDLHKYAFDQYSRRTLVSRDKEPITKTNRATLKHQRSLNKQNTFSSQSIVDFLVTSQRLNIFQVKFDGEPVLQFSDQLNHRERVPLRYTRLGNLLSRGISRQIEQLNQQMPQGITAL